MRARRLLLSGVFASGLLGAAGCTTPMQAATHGSAPRCEGWDREQGTHASAAMRNVNAFIDEWHDDAAHAQVRYFDKMAAEGVFIGTDKTERWTRDAFRRWAAPYFARGSAWSFTVRKRNVCVAEDAGSEGAGFVWFDEQLDSPFGILQASGVMRKAVSSYEILHYQLSLAVPNEAMDDVKATINKH